MRGKLNTLILSWGIISFAIWLLTSLFLGGTVYELLAFMCCLVPLGVMYRQEEVDLNEKYLKKNDDIY